MAPEGDHREVYLIFDDLGRLGHVWRKADEEATNFENVVIRLINARYSNPIGIFCFNTNEGWSRDVSEDIAREVRRLLDLERRDVPACLEDFLERHEGHRQFTLRLA
jgi:hypothetical protein